MITGCYWTRVTKNVYSKKFKIASFCKSCTYHPLVLKKKYKYSNSSAESLYFVRLVSPIVTPLLTEVSRTNVIAHTVTVCKLVKTLIFSLKSSKFWSFYMGTFSIASDITNLHVKLNKLFKH